MFVIFPALRYTFASGSADNIKQWMFPDGNFIQNLSGHNAIINTLAVNSDGVLVSGGIVSLSHQQKLRNVFGFNDLYIYFNCSPFSRQWNHPHVGLEDRLQLPADSCSRAARVSGQRVGHLRLYVRPLGKQADHCRGRQDH